MKPRALLSLTDKTGVVPFAQGLVELDYELLSTGGTAKALREAGLPVTDVANPPAKKPQYSPLCCRYHSDALSTEEIKIKSVISAAMPRPHRAMPDIFRVL